MSIYSKAAVCSFSSLSPAGYVLAQKSFGIIFNPKKQRTGALSSKNGLKELFGSKHFRWVWCT